MLHQRSPWRSPSHKRAVTLTSEEGFPSSFTPLAPGGILPTGLNPIRFGFHCPFLAWCAAVFDLWALKGNSRLRTHHPGLCLALPDPVSAASSHQKGRTLDHTAKFIHLLHGDKKEGSCSSHLSPHHFLSSLARNLPLDPLHSFQ